jgi:hypothetical protein
MLHFGTPLSRRLRLWPLILRQAPGLTASTRVRDNLKVPGIGVDEIIVTCRPFAARNQRGCDAIRSARLQDGCGKTRYEPSGSRAAVGRLAAERKLLTGRHRFVGSSARGCRLKYVEQGIDHAKCGHLDAVLQ